MGVFLTKPLDTLIMMIQLLLFPQETDPFIPDDFKPLPLWYNHKDPSIHISWYWFLYYHTLIKLIPLHDLMLLINTIIHNGLTLTYLKCINTLFKAVYVTGLLPYVALIALLARSLTLPGGFQGIQLFFKPDWEQLKNPMVSIYKLSCPRKWLLAQCKVTLHAKMVMLDLQHYP